MNFMEKTKKKLASTIVTGAIVMSGSAGQAQTSAQTDLRSSDEIRPFHIKISEAALTDLRQTY